MFQSVKSSLEFEFVVSELVVGEQDIVVDTFIICCIPTKKQKCITTKEEAFSLTIDRLIAIEVFLNGKKLKQTKRSYLNVAS